MTNQADFFEEDIPSCHLELLSQMKGRTIKQLRKLAWEEPKVECQERKLEPQMSFIKSCGTVVLDLDSGLQIGFFYRSKPPSLIMGCFQKSSGERHKDANFEENPDAHFIDCNDTVYSDQKYARFIEKKIKKIKILKGFKMPTLTWMRPVEAGISMTMEDGDELIIGYHLAEDPGATSPLTRDMLTPEVLKTLEEIEV